jgi:hypothetical protein
MAMAEDQKVVDILGVPLHFTALTYPYTIISLHFTTLHHLIERILPRVT